MIQKDKVKEQMADDKKKSKVKKVSTKKVKVTKKKAKDEIVEVDCATISFTFPMTKSEAREIMADPEGETMKNFTSYLNRVVRTAAKKYTGIPDGETVTNCKVEVE